MGHEHCKVINSYAVAIGQKIRMPLGDGHYGEADIEEVRECSLGLGPDHLPQKDVKVNGEWYTIEEIYAANKWLLLPEERTSATDIEGPNEDWIS